MAERVKRPFWLHQIAEYVIGVALIGSGLQSQSPEIPAVLGALVVLNAAAVDAPLGAFRVIGRGMHRVLDIVLVAVGFAATALPGLDLGTRIVQLCCVIVLTTVVLNTRYAPDTSRRGPARPAGEAYTPVNRADDIGRTAGRVAGTLAGRARASWRAGRASDSSVTAPGPHGDTPT